MSYRENKATDSRLYKACYLSEYAINVNMLSDQYLFIIVQPKYSGMSAWVGLLLPGPQFHELEGQELIQSAVEGNS